MCALGCRPATSVQNMLRSIQSLSDVSMHCHLQTYLTPPRVLTLEDVIGYVAGDELIEVTPKSIRLRKQILESNLRKSGKKKALS